MPRPLTLGHSPDADDAFMFYALSAGRIDTLGWSFTHVLQDIQTLNERAVRAELDITAVSIHAYPDLADHYVLTNCGASMGDGYGPLVVARKPLMVSDLRGRTIAIPGKKTTAYLVLCLLLGRDSFIPIVTPFDEIPSRVAAGEVEAGLIIHEGQLTYQREGLHLVVDLGVWWKSETGAPLPLGGNAVRRTLGMTSLQEIAGILKKSIVYGLAHRDEALAHALGYGRGLQRSDADRFVGMYVNEWTVDWGPIGRKAVTELLRRGHEMGLTKLLESIDFVG